MIRKGKEIGLLLVMIMSCIIIFLSSCKERATDGLIVFTQVAGNLQESNYIDGNSWRYFGDSRIVSIDPVNTEASINVLTKGFYSACSPAISYDGAFMLFTAQKHQNDSWQIWEMNLKNLKARQVTVAKENCFDPAYLPDGRIVFSKFSTNDKIKAGHGLFTCNLDGSDSRQITYNPHAYFASTVLQDGRILTIGRPLYPDQKDGVLMVLRPDGTKQELFYKGLKGSDIHSKSREMKNGKIIFIETSNTKKEGGDIIAINYNRPLHSRVNLSTDIQGDFYDASPLKNNTLLVSYRLSKNDPYALGEFDIENKKLIRVIHKDEQYNVQEAVVVNKQERPKKLPSELNLAVKTGLLLCQNINFTDMEAVENNAGNSKAVSIELMGTDSLLGVVDVERDGSFYLKVLADTPFRIRTLDEHGQVVNGPGSWLYVRPNERRGCVGCHEDNEQVPENRQPLSVKKDPILIPVQKEEVHYKNDTLK